MEVNLNNFFSADVFLRKRPMNSKCSLALSFFFFAGEKKMCNFNEEHNQFFRQGNSLGKHGESGEKLFCLQISENFFCKSNR